jgi:recombination protein RecT
MTDAGFSIEKVKQEISFALQLINKSAQLQKCTKQSLQVAVLNISNIGLSLNPAAKEAYLIPRWNNVTKVTEASLEPGYVGLVKLLTDAGSVKSMTCQLVYDADIFTVDLANNNQPVKHNPELSKSKRGNIKGAYALATLVDGTRQVEYMSIEDIDEIKTRSETFKAYLEGKIKSCTWVSDYGEMSRKTVIKRIYKYLPRTERMEKIDEAIKHDNSDFGISDAQVYYIENLINNSTLDSQQRENLELEVATMGATRAGEVINMLKLNQQLSDKDAFKKLKVNA